MSAADIEREQWEYTEIYNTLISQIERPEFNLVARVKDIEKFRDLFNKAQQTYHFPVDYTPIPNGNTLLHTAIDRNNEDIAHFLLDCGADVNRTNHKGMTPLMLAAEKKWVTPSLFERLIDRTADLNALDTEGTTALGQLIYDYVFWGDSESTYHTGRSNKRVRIEQLLKAGADAEIDDEWSSLCKNTDIPTAFSTKHRREKIKERQQEIWDLIENVKEQHKQLHTKNVYSFYEYDYEI